MKTESAASATVPDSVENRRGWRSVVWALCVGLAVAGSAAVVFVPRLYNHREVVAKGSVFFVEADCYARMIRAREVFENPGRVVREHKFENWPEGTQPHTTAPLDYLIAGLAAVIPSGSVFPGVEKIEVGGALIGPVLGGLAGVLLALGWLWGRVRYGWTTVILFAVSPAIMWATVLGRPDHQALLVLLLAVALWCEVWMLLDGGQSARMSSVVPWVSGAAWGLALWTSLFEPLILLVVCAVIAWVSGGWGTVKRRMGGWGLCAGIFGLSLLIEGLRFTMPGAGAAFANWSRLIPELRRPGLAEAPRWGGWVIVAAPVLVFSRGVLSAVRRKGDLKPLAGLLALLLTVTGLAFWQQRWSPYAVLCATIALPWGLMILRRGTLATMGVAAALALSLWPAAVEWELLLFPNSERQALLRERREEALMLRTIAAGLRAERASGFGVLAPYWLCPPLAYWSGCPAVGGTSHQSLAGIVATAEFYLEEDDEAAARILDERRAGWVLAYDAKRVMATSQILLKRAGTAASMGRILADEPDLVPRFLQASVKLGPFVLYRVQPRANPSE